MVLAERINPDKQALAIATPDSVYVWAYDKPQKIASREERRTTSLACLNGRLLDNGSFNGVFDTLENKIVFNGHYNKIAASNGRLYGTVAAGISSDGFRHAIHDVQSRETVRMREGNITMLAGEPFLMDAGEYIELTEKGRYEDFSLYDTLKNEILTFGSNSSLLATVPALEKELFVATNDRVYQQLMHDASPDLYDFAKMRAHMLKEKTGLENMSSETRDAVEAFVNKPFEGEKALFYLRHPLIDEVHNAYNFITNSADYKTFEQKRSTLENWYGWLDRVRKMLPKTFFTNALKQYTGGEKGGVLNDMLEITTWVYNHCCKKYGIRSLANVNDNLIAGCASGDLLIVDKRLNHKEQFLWNFSKPITALCTIPMEVYDSGIKQKILERIRQRAYFAGRKGHQIAYLEPMRKAA